MLVWDVAEFQSPFSWVNICESILASLELSINLCELTLASLKLSIDLHKFVLASLTLPDLRGVEPTPPKVFPL